MKAAIVPNYEKAGVERILSDLIALLDSLNIENIIAKKKSDIRKCDILITIGGDGTIIHAAKSGAELGIPILGINAGRLGYLADITPGELEKLSLLKTGDYIIEERMLLEVILGGKKYYCLNDAVISKGALSRMIDVDISIGNDTISYRADGLIAATPTGSTAYSMSAGGPVVEPSLDLMILTPICSNSLFDRPIIFGGESIIEVTPNCPKNAEAFLTVDGEKSLKIKAGESVIIKKSATTAKLIKIHKHSFYKTLSEKMRG